MSGRTLMVQGTASSVGKSLITTALCRLYSRRGLRVAPFKSQNMALNSAVTPDGAEIGRAQLVQAEAARAVPCADMNPILLKPETPSASQVVVLGRSRGTMNFRDYHQMKPELRELVGAALDRLRAQYDLVLIEGAGSPAEVNLKERDLVNMWVAARAEAKVVLVTDIERGGALAALVGTLALLEPEERARVSALVVNKFRGDPGLFVDGIRFLEQRTGVPVAGVIPHLGDLGIASEDSLDLRPQEPSMSDRAIAILKLPRLSNFDEFEPLARELPVRWCTRPAEFEDAPLVIVPGTKCTVDDLGWLHRTGLAEALLERARRGQPILGICGGYQLLGREILDPEGIESSVAQASGLGLLPIVTRFEREKITWPVRLRLGSGLPLLDSAAMVEARGYEIHCGRVSVAPKARPLGQIVQRGSEPCDAAEGAVAGSVAGTLVHGLFENAPVRAALAKALGYSPTPTHPSDPYDALADHLGNALDLKLIDRLVGL